MKKWIVYRHTSPSGKVYIGITSQRNVKIRWCRGSAYKGCPYFFRALTKYGWDTIKHEILFDNLEEDKAKNLEISMIKHYKNLRISYNITNGGDGKLGLKCSEYNKNKMSKERSGIIPWHAINASVAANKGKKRGPRDRELVEKIRASRIKNGKKCTKEMIQANIERNLNRCHPVLQYDLNGNLVAEYRSVKYASELMKVSRGSLISCLTGKNHSKTCKGYLWKYKLL